MCTMQLYTGAQTNQSKREFLTNQGPNPWMTGHAFPRVATGFRVLIGSFYPLPLLWLVTRKGFTD